MTSHASMIPEEARTFFEESTLRNSLEAIYKKVPSGSCVGNTGCCSESVNTFYAEYLNLVLLLESKGLLKYYAKEALRYYLTELVVPMKCPLLQEDGLCSCYEARPLPCRIFGHLSHDEYEENYEAVLEENLAAATELKECFGIIVPDEVSSQKVSFCSNFKSDTGFTLEQRDDLVDELFGVESTFLMEELLDPEDFGLSLVQWFSYGILGREKAQELRVTVSQEFSEVRCSETLQKTLEDFV